MVWLGGEKASTMAGTSMCRWEDEQNWNFYVGNEAAHAFNDQMIAKFGDGATPVWNNVDPDHVNAKIPVMCDHKECRRLWQFCSNDKKAEDFVGTLKEEKRRASGPMAYC